MKVKGSLALASLALLLLATCAMAAEDEPVDQELDTGDCTQTQLTKRNYDEVYGDDANGGINRHGDLNQAIGGPHGSTNIPDDRNRVAKILLNLVVKAVLNQQAAR